MTVLVVEDEVFTAMDVARVLEEAGHRVCGIAADKAEALRLGERFRPDAALVDLDLADGRTGLEVTRELWRRHGTACVLATAHPAGAVARGPARGLGAVREALQARGGGGHRLLPGAGRGREPVGRPPARAGVAAGLGDAPAARAPRDLGLRRSRPPAPSLARAPRGAPGKPGAPPPPRPREQPLAVRPRLAPFPAGGAGAMPTGPGCGTAPAVPLATDREQGHGRPETRARARRRRRGGRLGRLGPAGRGPAGALPPEPVRHRDRLRLGRLQAPRAGQRQLGHDPGRRRPALQQLGDGGGFGSDAAARAYVSLGVARLAGASAATIQGVNLIGGLDPSVAPCFQYTQPDKVERDPGPGRPCYGRGRHGKSWGVLARGDQLYLWVSPASAPWFLYDEARLYRARLGTNEWTRAAWAFADTDPVPVIEPAFLQAGRDHGDVPDYLYVYAPRRAPVTLAYHDVQRGPEGGQVMLMRVPESGDPLRREDYEYFAGADAAGAPAWTRDPAGMRPALTDPNGVGWTVSAAYVEELGRYLLITEHARSKRGLLGVFEAENPWGPWRTAFYGTLTDGTALVPATAFFANVVPGSAADGGRRLTLAFTGVFANDALNLVDVRLTLDEAFR